MFAHRYFAGRYFATRYFPNGGEIEPPEPQPETDDGAKDSPGWVFDQYRSFNTRSKKKKRRAVVVRHVNDLTSEPQLQLPKITHTEATAEAVELSAADRMQVVSEIAELMGSKVSRYLEEEEDAAAVTALLL